MIHPSNVSFHSCGYHEPNVRDVPLPDFAVGPRHSFRPAPQHVTLFGDASQPGLYVDRIKFLPGMKVMPHWHPDVRPLEVLAAGLQDDVGLRATRRLAGGRS